MSTQPRKVANGVNQRQKSKKTAKNRSKDRSNRSIPTIEIQKSLVVRRRFQANGAVAGNFTIQSGNNQFLVATTAAFVVPSVQMWRIKKIEAWSTCISSGNEGYVEITPIANDTGQNNFNSRVRTMMDVTNSPDIPAHVKVVPKTTEPLGSWHYSNTTNTGEGLFALTCSINSTMDVTFEVVLGYDSPVQNYSAVVAGATAGTYYSRIPMTNLTPFGINVI